MDAYSCPAPDRNFRAPIESPLSPLDALGKVSRLARKESLLKQASGPHGRVGGGPSRGSSLRGGGGGRELRLELGEGKGKGREVGGEERGAAGWEQGGLRSEEGEDQYARAPREQVKYPQPSPILKHAFHSSIASTSLTGEGSPRFDSSDTGDSSPVMPSHLADSRGAYPALRPSPSAQAYTPSHAYNPSQSTDQSLSRASSNASQQRRIPAGLQRNPSGRKYPGLDAEEETESLRGDRSTWHSEYDNQRESVANSTNGDPFHYSVSLRFGSPCFRRTDAASDVRVAPLSLPLPSRSHSPPPSLNLNSLPIPPFRLSNPYRPHRRALSNPVRRRRTRRPPRISPLGEP